MDESDDEDDDNDDVLGDNDSRHKMDSGKPVTLEMIKEWRTGLEVQSF